jgi:hypothetical protein
MFLILRTLLGEIPSSDNVGLYKVRMPVKPAFKVYMEFLNIGGRGHGVLLTASSTIRANPVV